MKTIIIEHSSNDYGGDAQSYTKPCHFQFLNYVKDMLAKIKPVLNEKMDEVCVFITQHDPTNKGVLSYPQFQEMMKLVCIFFKNFSFFFKCRHF